MTTEIQAEKCTDNPSWDVHRENTSSVHAALDALNGALRAFQGAWLSYRRTAIHRFATQGGLTTPEEIAMVFLSATILEQTRDELAAAMDALMEVLQ